MYDTNELGLIRSALDSITIKGADAKFLAQLQVKIVNEIEKISALKKTPRSKK